MGKNPGHRISGCSYPGPAGILLLYHSHPRTIPLLIDLTIIYTFVTPIAWGVGIGLGAGIAIFLGFGLKDRAPGIMDDLLKRLEK